jgi:hypothetical protein
MYLGWTSISSGGVIPLALVPVFQEFGVQPFLIVPENRGIYRFKGIRIRTVVMAW